MTPYALLAAAALAATPPAVAPGEPARLFVLPALNEDAAMDLLHRPTAGVADFTGVRPPHPARALVLWFFSRDRGGDRLDELDRIQRRFDGRGAQVLAVCMDDAPVGELTEWVRERGVSYPVLRDDHGVVAARYGISDPPLLLVVDADGRIFAIGNPEGDGFEQAVAAELEPLLRRR